MPALHTPSSGGGWFDPQQPGPEYRARPTDVAPEASWGYPPHGGASGISPDGRRDASAGRDPSPRHPTGYRPPSQGPATGYGPDESRYGLPPPSPAAGYGLPSQGHASGYGPAESDPAGYGPAPRHPSGYGPAESHAAGYGPPHAEGYGAAPGGRTGYDGPGQQAGYGAYPQRDAHHNGYPQADPQGEPGAGQPSKAGRNLPMAITVGVTLGALVIGSLYFWRPAFVVLATAAILLGIWEMVRAVEPVEARPPLPPLMIGGAAIMVLAWFAGIEAMVLGLVLTVVAVLVWRLSDGPVGYQRDFTAATLIASYVPFLAGFAILLVQPADGAFRVTIMIATVVLSDVGGYATGVFLGRHPMAPTVSPKKSWEGFAGSLVASAAGAAVMLSLMLDRPWWQGAVFGVAIAFAATLGDLSESLMKRDLGIKDMGQLLPGHGGLMDRLDSLLLAAPVAYLLLVLFAPPTG